MLVEQRTREPEPCSLHSFMAIREADGSAIQIETHGLGKSSTPHVARREKLLPTASCSPIEERPKEFA